VLRPAGNRVTHPGPPMRGAASPSCSLARENLFEILSTCGRRQGGISIEGWSSCQRWKAALLPWRSLFGMSSLLLLLMLVVVLLNWRAVLRRTRMIILVLIPVLMMMVITIMVVVVMMATANMLMLILGCLPGRRRLMGARVVYMRMASVDLI